MTRFVEDRSPALTTLTADRSWTLATVAGVVVAVVAGVVVAVVAGLIAGRDIGERSGVVGLAKDATILPVRVVGREDQDADRVPRIAEGIRWAAGNGAKVMNLSLSTPFDPPAINAAIKYALSKDVVIVASAGNRATASETADGARFPAAYPGVIGVAATDAKDVVTEDSIHGEHVSLAAPGYSVVTAFRDWGDCVYGTQGQSSSFATGYVSAAAALLRQRFPQESAAQITHRLEVTASRAKRDARDDKAGWGLIQPYEPMTLAYDISVGGVHRPGLHRRARRVLLAAHRLARVGAGPRHRRPARGLGVRACCRRCADGPRSRCWPLTGRSPAWPTGSC